MSGGDSLEHKCQTGVEDILARMRLCFSCICQTDQYNTTKKATFSG